MPKGSNCPCCNIYYTNITHLMRHMKNSSKGCSKFILTCSGCNKEFSSQEKLTQHQLKRRNQGHHKCYDKSSVVDLSSTIQMSDLNHITSSGQKISYASEQQISIQNDFCQQTIFDNNRRESTQSVNYKQAFSSASDVLNHDNFSVLPKETTKSKHGKKVTAIKSTSNIPVWNTINSKSKFKKLPKDIEGLTVFKNEYSPHFHISQRKRKLDQSAEVSEGYLDPRISHQTIHKQTQDVRNMSFFGNMHNNNMTYEVIDEGIHKSNDKTNETTRVKTNIPTDNESTNFSDVKQTRYIQEAENEFDYVFDLNLDEDLLTDSDEESNTYDDVRNIDDQYNNVVNDNQPNLVQQNVPTCGEHSQYIFDRCEFNKSHRTNLIWDETDHALFDLYNMHRKSRAPVGLFDSTIEWMRNHAHVLFNKSTCSLKRLPSRKVFVKSMYKKVYGKQNYRNVRPYTVDVSLQEYGLPPTNTTVFDFREVLIDLLSNEDIMNPNRLLFFDHEDPTKIHPPGSPIGESITSEVARHAHKRLCTEPNDVLWGCCAYNDEINFDRFGKLQLDPFSLSFLRLPVSIRNQPWAWRFFGLVHGIDSPTSETSKKLDSQTKLQVYHKVLKKIFKCFNEINLEGGIPWNLKLRNGTIKKVNLKLYLQFIIGDTKGHDAHCNRYASHAKGVKQTVRDCDVSQELCDNIDHVCHFRNVNDIKHLTKESTNMLSFHKIDNAFWDVELGDEIHGILGATLGEPLHILGQGLHIYQTVEFTKDFSTASFVTLENYVRHIVKQSDSQISKKPFPYVTAFRNGLTSVKLLTAKEKHARIFVTFIALMFPDCVKQLATSKAKRNSNNLGSYGIDRLKKWFTLQEDTLILWAWLKKEVHPAKDLYSPQWYERWITNLSDGDILPLNDDNMVDNNSPAQKKILEYMRKFNDLVGSREGNGLKIPKFHLMKHFVRNIVRHGAVGNYDGSRPEANAKEIAKTPGIRTQMHHGTISIQTANRYHEDLTILECERLYHRHCSLISDNSQGNTNYMYFNKDEDSTLFNLDDVGSNVIGDEATYISKKKGSKFEMFLVDRPTVPNVYTCQIKWLNSLPITRIDDNMLYCITNWLWVNPVGGLLTKDSKCVGFTEYTKDDYTYRCHPSFRKKNPWFDWALIKWEGFIEPVLGRILMFFDLSDCTFVEDEGNSNSLSRDIIIDNDASDATLETDTSSLDYTSEDYKKKHKLWVVVHSGVDSCIDETNYPSIYNFKSKIVRRVLMEDKKYRVLPIESIVGPAFAFMMKNIDHNRSQISEDNCAIVLDHPSTWAEKFL